MKILKLLGALSITLLLTSCAFTPEKVQLNPTINVPQHNIGQNKKIYVNVIDARPTESLGGRASGYGPAANISLDSDIKMTVKNAIYTSLHQSGFRPVNNPAAKRELIVRITGLTYQQRMGLWVGHIIVNCSMEASAKNNAKIFDQVYRGTIKKDVVVTPTANADSQHINAVLSITLNKMLLDESLLKFLAAPKN